MRRRSKILLLGACILIALVVVCFYSLRDNEPSYNGRTLSEWLGVDYQPIDDYKAIANQDSVIAVRAMGTNIVPILMHWYCETNGRLQTVLENAVEQSPNFIGRSWIGRYVFRQSDYYKQGLAMNGFRVLQSNAFPSLVSAAKSTDVKTRNCALAVCRDIGLVQLRRRQVDDPDENVRKTATNDLRIIAPEFFINGQLLSPPN